VLSNTSTVTDTIASTVANTVTDTEAETVRLWCHPLLTPMVRIGPIRGRIGKAGGPPFLPPALGPMTRTTSTTTSTTEPAPSALMAELLAAFHQVAAQGPSKRSSAAAAPVDPWEGVTLTLEQERALIKLGWHQQGWTVREKASRQALPPHLAKAGPQQPDARKVAEGLVDVQGLANWSALGMICARLAAYGKLHVGAVAQVLVATGAAGDWSATPGKFASKLGSVLRVKITRTGDGYYEATPNGHQPMHDVLARMADGILKPAQPAKPAKPAD
jgi:hypothetical protein